MLPVETGIHAGRSAFGDAASAVTIQGGSSGKGFGEDGCILFVSPVAQSDRSGEKVEGIQFITGIDVPEKIGGCLLADFTSARYVRTTFRMLGRGLGGALLILHSRIQIAAYGEFPFLRVQIESSVITSAAVNPGADTAVYAVRDCTAAGLCAGGNEVQHSAGALGIILGPGVRNDLYVLDGGGRHHLENLRRVGTQHLVRLAVNIYLEGTASVHGDVVLAVDCDHGHLPKHLQHGIGLGVRVAFNVVAYFVGFHFDERFRRCHLGTVQCLDVVAKPDRT